MAIYVGNKRYAPYIGDKRRRYMGGGGDAQPKPYLAFVAIEDGTFSFTNAINYSIDDGSTWTALPANTTSPTVLADSKIMFKATLTPSGTDGIGTFNATGKFNAEGNIMSLVYGYNFVGKDSIPQTNYYFSKLFFRNKKIVSAGDMITPSVLCANCYQQMFYECTSLKTAPILPATTLVSNCYNSMFWGCTILNYIKAMFTTAPSTSYMFYWVRDVPSSGTFVKNSAATWTNSFGVSAIPTGWTVQTASE